MLIGCVIAITGLKTQGLSTIDGFTTTPDAVTGQHIYDNAVPNAKGAGAPADILYNADKTDAVLAAVKQVPGVSQAPNGVCVQVDYAKAAAAIKANPAAAAQFANACPPAALQVQPIDGKLLISATLNYSYDTQQAYDTIKQIRSAVGNVSGADALVGGSSATNLDIQDASRHDRNLIIPLVLLVIMIVLGLVLRALLAPLILIATVVLSFTASLGVSAIFFNHVFHFANADPAFPLFAFVFLVALGIDYNIFLMTRVREETLAVRHQRRDRARPGRDRWRDHVGGRGARGDLRRAGHPADRVPRRDRLHRRVRRAARHDPGAIDPGPGAELRHRQEDLVAVEAVRGRRQGLTR